MVNKGRLYALGSNSNGQLGLGHREDVDTATPCLFIRTKSTESSDHTTSCLASPETGIADGDGVVTAATSPDLPSPVCKIVAGGSHTLVLLESGAAYAAGNPDALGGALIYAGRGDDRGGDAVFFRQVAWLDDNGEMVTLFTDISASWSASFFVVAPRREGPSKARPGMIYACGKGERGELGLGKDVVATKKPRCLAVFGNDHGGAVGDNCSRPIVQVPGRLTGICSCVSHSTAYFADPCDIYGWGACRQGQLGEKLKIEKSTWEPRRIAPKDLVSRGQIRQISSASLGRDFSLLCIASEEQGQQQSKWRLLGGNRFFNSNRDDIEGFLAGMNIRTSDQEAPDADVISFASWSKLYFLNESTLEVKAFGRANHGPPLPEMLPKLRLMAVGSEHCVGLTLEQRLIAWGWKEHGNCGSKEDETENGWTVLSLPIMNCHSVVGIGAGCATTFVWTQET